MTAPMLLIQGEHDQYGTLAQIDAIERGVRGPVTRAVLDAGTRRTSRRPRRRCAAAAEFLELTSSEHFVVPFEAQLRRAYGLEYLGRRAGGVTTAPDMLGADGTVLSGVYAAIAESLASTGTAVEVVPQGLIPSGLSNSTHVIGEARTG